ISVSSDGPYEEFRLDEPTPAAPPPSTPRGASTVECPPCHAPNPPTNLHCQDCGARLRLAPQPTGPRPPVPATPGVPAALATRRPLLVVILVALAVNLFGGDGTATSTTVPTSTTTTEPQVVENAPIQVLSVTCTQPGLGPYVCDNLINGEGSEYQGN